MTNNLKALPLSPTYNTKTDNHCLLYQDSIPPHTHIPADGHQKMSSSPWLSIIPWILTAILLCTSSIWLNSSSFILLIPLLGLLKFPICDKQTQPVTLPLSFLVIIYPPSNSSLFSEDITTGLQYVPLLPSLAADFTTHADWPFFNTSDS